MLLYSAFGTLEPFLVAEVGRKEPLPKSDNDIGFAAITAGVINNLFHNKEIIYKNV